MVGRGGCVVLGRGDGLVGSIVFKALPRNKHGQRTNICLILVYSSINVTGISCSLFWTVVFSFICTVKDLKR